jgi:hypothetical protein
MTSAKSYITVAGVCCVILSQILLGHGRVAARLMWCTWGMLAPMTWGGDALSSFPSRWTAERSSTIAMIERARVELHLDEAKDS